MSTDDPRKVIPGPGRPAAFSVEFKRSSVRKLLQEGANHLGHYPTSKVAKEVGVSDASLSMWKQLYGKEVQAEIDRENGNTDVQPDLDELDELTELSEAYVTPEVSTVSVTMDIPTFLLPLSDDQFERMAEFLTEKLRATYGRTE